MDQIVSFTVTLIRVRKSHTNRVTFLHKYSLELQFITETFPTFFHNLQQHHLESFDTSRV